MRNQERRREVSKVLKPCPFCGGKAYLENSHRSFVDAQSTRVSFVRCRVCNARSARFDNHRFGQSEALDLAIKSWNRRVRKEDG